MTDDPMTDESNEVADREADRLMRLFFDGEEALYACHPISHCPAELADEDRLAWENGYRHGAAQLSQHEAEDAAETESSAEYQDYKSLKAAQDIDESSAEIHEFDTHKAIIGHLIHSQNGTIGTALRELVMNALDAGSPTCDIKLGLNGFEVTDTGKGFPDREYIEKFFKCFGEPHKDGDATFGRFRIGRGQIMSFGKIVWHSQKFKMITDVKELGHQFKLVENEADVVPGCRVTGLFYKPIGEWDLQRACDDIEALVRYSDCEIRLNGIRVSADPGLTWDYEDDDLKICWKPVRAYGIKLYSLGIFVKHLDDQYYGLTADIVTKKAMKLNMARNEISSEDPLWSKITAILKEKSLKAGREQSRRSSRMDEATRRGIIQQFIAGELYDDEACSLPLLRDCRGKTFSIDSLLQEAGQRANPISISPDAGSRVADKLAMQRTAKILHHEELRVWRSKSLDQMFERICSAVTSKNGRKSLMQRLTPFETLREGFVSEHKILKTQDLTPAEKAAFAALQYANSMMARKLNGLLDGSLQPRKLLIGESDTAEGWTDGLSYIAIDRRMLQRLDKGMSGAIDLCLLLLHEYTHNEHDTGSHCHGLEFYESFHDFSMGDKSSLIGDVSASLHRRHTSELACQLEAPPREVLVKSTRLATSDIAHYTLHMGPPGLSDLARIVILGIEARRDSYCHFAVGKSAIKVTFHRWKSAGITSSIRDYMSLVMREDGFAVPDESEIRALSANRQEANDVIQRETERLLDDWSQKQGHDLALATWLWHMEGRLRKHGEDTILMVLQALCRDKNSGFLEFHGTDSRNMPVLGSALYLHKLGPGYQFQFRRGMPWDYTLRTKKSSRVAFVIDRIKSVVDGITDPVERQEFIDAFFSENLAGRFRKE